MRHGFDDKFHVFFGDAKDTLAQHYAVMRHVLIAGLRQLFHRHEVLTDPLAIRLGGGKRVLDFGVINNAPGIGVYQKHPAGLHAGAFDHVLWVNI